MVRSMCKNDIPQVAKMLEDLHTLHCAHVPDVFSAYPFEHFKQEAAKIFKDRQQIKLVFELDGCSVGMCAAVLRDASRGRIGEIHAFYVRADCRPTRDRHRTFAKYAERFTGKGCLQRAAKCLGV